MIPFYSKRNQVYPVVWKGRAAVEKHFSFLGDWQRESALYTMLAGKLPLPDVLENRPGVLVLEYCPFATMLDVLEQQEKTGFDPTPWQALAAWIKACHKLCGQLPGEGNLRNFLWDAEQRQIVGLDFECYAPKALPDCGAAVIAALLEYAPAGTPVKRQAAHLLATEWRVSEPAIAAGRQALCIQRSQRKKQDLSGIVLAGGASRRMGQSKAELPLLGRSLLEWQAEKFRAMGITDILLSGENCRPLPGTRVIPDELPDRGPLGGLHACLHAAKHDQCLVLSVDVPLVPCSVLSHLSRAHRGDVTVLRHAGKIEPLIGIYDKSLCAVIGQLISSGGVSVQKLADHAAWTFFDYAGPEVFLQNCNTPEEFLKIQAVEQLLLKV